MNKFLKYILIFMALLLPILSPVESLIPWILCYILISKYIKIFKDDNNLKYKVIHCVSYYSIALITTVLFNILIKYGTEFVISHLI